MSLHLKLITPDRILADEEVLAVSLPTPNGEITVLPHHAAIASLLSAGVIRVKRESGEEEVATSGGFIHVTETGEISVLADTAERGQELDLSTVEAAKKHAQEVMRGVVNKDDVAFAAAAAALEREMARHKVASRHHHRREPS